MRLAAAALFVSMAWTGCSLAGLDPPANVATATAAATAITITPALGQDFSLKPGEMAHLLGGALRVEFEGVPADSRCPKSERCVWQGDATVRVWLQHGCCLRQAHELHTASGDKQTVRVQNHELQLVRLDPHTTTGRAINPGDYAAVLRVSPARSAAGAPER
jgi:hypothetical protein